MPLVSLQRIVLMVVSVVLMAQFGWTADAETEPVAADFAPLNADWNTRIQRLEELATEFQKASAEDKGKIRTEYFGIIEQADKLLPRLAVAAEKKLQESGAAGSDEAKFLSEFVGELNRRDDYEEAARLSALLFENKVEDQGALEAAGIAAFMLADFDTAAKRFDAAQQKGSLGGQAQELRGNLDYYQKIWKDEQAARAADGTADDLPRVKFKTSKGDVLIELFENEAPNTVANFISLVEKGYYNGLVFHRVLPNFMAQGGCPEGTGTGGPGYHIPCECANENHRNHFRGSLSMAHAGKDTGGSQFFLNFVPTRHLDGKHTVFGRVIEGFDVLAKLQRRNPGAANAPQPDKIVQAEVVRKRDHEYKPKTLPASS